MGYAHAPITSPSRGASWLVEDVPIRRCCNCERQVATLVCRKLQLWPRFRENIMGRADSAICRSFDCFSVRRRGGFAVTLFFYLTPIIAFFAFNAIGLWRLSGEILGMYDSDDGMWAAWNLRGIFEWSRPFDLAPFNPLSGMGSTFVPNTPWLNPAALALALPLPRELCYLISYFIYFVELSLSLVLLFRVIGLAPLEAIFCSQLYLLVLFPPTTGIFVHWQWYSMCAGVCPSWDDLEFAVGTDLDHGPLWFLGQRHYSPSALCFYSFAGFSPRQSCSSPMLRPMRLPV